MNSMYMPSHCDSEDDKDSDRRGDLAHTPLIGTSPEKVEPDGVQPQVGLGTVRRSPSSESWASSTALGAPVSRSDPLAVLGKAITSRIESRPASSTAIRSMPSASRRAAGRRSASPRAGSRSAPRPPARRCRARRRPAAGRRGGGYGSTPPPISSRRARRRRRGCAAVPGSSNEPTGEVNGWCSGVPAPLLLAPLEHREVHHPQQVVRRRRARGRSGARAPAAARRAPCAAVAALSATISSRSPGCGAELAPDRRALVVGEELGDRRAPAPVLLHERPHEAAGAEALTTSVSPSSSERGTSRAPALRPRTTPPDASAPAKTLNSELSRARRRGHGSRGRSAVSGRSRAEARHRLVVAHPRQRRRRRLDAAGPEQPREHPLDHLDHVVLLDERHLEVELRELRLAVGAQVLVPEAAGDLVVALEAGHHQQLLEQLRRLRQRVEDARAACARARGSRARPPASSA